MLKLENGKKAGRVHRWLRNLDVGFLRDSFYALRRKTSPGIDGVIWQEYETGL